MRRLIEVATERRVTIAMLMANTLRAAEIQDK